MHFSNTFIKVIPRKSEENQQKYRFTHYILILIHVNLEALQGTHMLLWKIKEHQKIIQYTEKRLTRTVSSSA